MPDSSELLQHVKHYQKSLTRYSQAANDTKMLHCILKLYKMPITVSHLEQTGIGRTVNSLRKLEGEVGDAARALVAKWKQMVSGNDDYEDSKHSNKNEESESNQLENNKKHAVSNSSHKHSDKHKVNGVKEKSSKDNKYKSTEERSTSETRHKSLSKSEHRSSSITKEKCQQSSDSENEPIKQESESSDSDYQSSNGRSESSSESEQQNKYNEYVDKKLNQRSSKYREKSEEKYSKEKYDSIKEGSKDRSRSKDSTRKSDSSRSESDKKRKHHSSSSSEKKHSDSSTTKSSSNKRRHDSTSSNEEPDRKISKKSPHDSYKSSSSSHKSKESNTSRENKDSKENKKNTKHESDKKESKSSSSSSSDKSEKRKHDSHKGDRTKTDKSKSENLKSDKSSSSTSNSHKDKSKSSKHSSKSSGGSQNSSSKKVVVDAIGIGSESGTSFADALGMLEPTTSKGSKKPKPLEVTPKPEKIEKVVERSEKKEKPSPEKHSVEKSSKSSKVEVIIPPPPPVQKMDIDIASLLPTITPNYRPVANPFLDCNSRNKIMNDDEALSLVMSQKNQRTKVFSGNKTAGGNVPTLFDLSIRVLQDNIDALEYTGGVPYGILKPVIDKATPDQLFILEHHNPYLIEDTDDIWHFHCNKEFRNKKREELESWREMYMRCLDEREAKLKALTENIKLAQDKSTPVRQTKLAYIDSVVKPPRDVLRKQAKNNFDKKPAVTPTSRLSTIAAAGAAGQAVVPSPVRASSSGTSSSPAQKPKKAPLMQKTLALLKGSRFRR